MELFTLESVCLWDDLNEILKLRIYAFTGGRRFKDRCLKEEGKVLHRGGKVLYYC